MKPYYEQDGITIYHGDCREVLPTLERVDLVLTDPPYGKQYARGKNGIGAGGRFNLDSVSWDKKAPDVAMVEEITSKASKSIVWGCNHIGGLPSTNCFLIWDKQNGKNVYADAEVAWSNLTITTRIFRKQWIGGSITEHISHPTQKSLDLMKWCIELAGDVQTILDPFMGSGTTLRAAKDLGRKAIGIEIEERYCEIAANRLAQGVLFGVDNA